MKRRLYPVVKHGSRFALVSAMSVVGTLLVTLATNLAVYHGSFAEALKHLCLGLTGNVMLLTLPMIAVTSYLLFCAVRMREQADTRRLWSANPPPQLPTGDDAIEAG